MRHRFNDRRFYLAALLFMVCGLLLLVDALQLWPTASARVGGGHSYSSRGSSRSSSSSSRSSSSSSRSSGGGGGDIAPLFYFLFNRPYISVPLIIFIVFLYLRSRNNEPSDYSSRGGDAHWQGLAPNAEAQVTARLSELRKYDPNFSEILFQDFIYTLYARVQEARPTAALDQFASYLDKDVLRRLRALSDEKLMDVKGVIIGASHIKSVSDPAQPFISIAVEFEANYTEVYAADERGRQREQTFYAREIWTFTRRRDVLSRPPERITALHCPKCGGGLEKKLDGSCAYCGAVVTDGQFDWFVTEIRQTERVTQGPLLTSDVPEVGTDWPTRYQFGFTAARLEFMAQHPDFSWPQLESRMAYIFMELQQAWTNQQWERARPFETDNVFQAHLYWMTEYRRQRLRNVLADIRLEQIVPVKIVSDAFYDAITARIYASMIDYTANASGQVVSGNPHARRAFSEYWTFIRRRGSRPTDKRADQCPNCGAPLQINMSGVCQYCNGKITSGDFDWVLSRIEQDESYQG